MACTYKKSRFTYTYPRINKSDAQQAFTAFHVQAERETRCKPITVHFDIGGEFLEAIQTYYLNQGITIHFTVSHSPEMNGIAERVNRTLIEHACTMLWTAQLPIGFWTAVILMATFLKNRLPTKALNITPYKSYYNRKPNLEFICTVGCKAKVAIPTALC